jgi:hypothetical protein
MYRSNSHSIARQAQHAHTAVTHHAVAHGAHAASAVSSWPGATELSQFVSAHGTGILIALAACAVGIGLILAIGQACAHSYLRTDRASWSILDNGLTLSMFAVSGLALVAFVAPSTGVGGPLLRGLLSLAGAHLGGVGGGS